jgi:hypothetical protein
MGLLDALGYGSNPFASWLDQNRNSVVGGFGGLVGAANPHDAVAGFTRGLTDPNASVADQARQQALQQQQQDALAAKQQQEQQNATIAYLNSKGRDDLIAAINGGMPVADAWKNALSDTSGTAGPDPSEVATYKFYVNDEMKAGRAPKGFDEWSSGRKMSTRAGLGAPIYGKNRKTGEYMPFEPMSDGTITSLVDPNANPADFIFDPGTVASDKAAGTAYGTQQGGQQFNLPKSKQDIEQELSNIDAIAADTEGLDQVFGNVLGIPQQMLPTMPGTPKANAQERIKQVVGQNFLAAYSSLRGGGAITEVEGNKAQDAMARLSTAQSKEAFLQALADLKAILAVGYQRMSTQAGMGPYNSSGYTPPPLAGKNFVYNPETGELE